jgi:hypothetical protein
MPFTGQIGGPNSQFGNIVFGASTGVGLEPFDFEVHVLTSSHVRVLFTRKVTEDTALSPTNYLLTSLAPPSTAIVPIIDTVRFFDETRRSVVLELEQPLTYSTDYSLQVNNVRNDDGETMVGIVRNFTANVQDPPRVLGAWQSKRGYVDVLFDRSVGPTSTAATFEIRDASLPGPGVTMIQLTWATENIPETTLRLTLPGGTPTASAFEIDFVGVTDESLNVASGTVPLTLVLRSTPPYSLADLMQLQITNASIIGVSDDYQRYAIVRVFFNGPTVDAGTTGNWAAFQSGPHLVDPSLDVVTALDAISFNVPSLIALLVDFKAKFNAHLVRRGVHLEDDTSNTITQADPTDQASCTIFINDVQPLLLAHLDELYVHTYPDTIHTFNDINVYPGMPNEETLTTSIANNYLKGKFNDHLQDEYPITQFIPVWSGVLNQIEPWATYNTIRHYETEGPYTLFADLHLLLDTHKASIRLEATLTSEDGFSTTTPADFTGSIVAPASSNPPEHLSTLVETDQTVEILFDRDLILPGPNAVNVYDENNRPAGPGVSHVTSNLVDLERALKHLMAAYKYHISGAGAGHQRTDTHNLISPPDAPLFPTVQSLIDSANEFKETLTNHMTNHGGEWHEHPDPNIIRSAEAWDFETAFILVDDIIRTFLRHNGGYLQNGRAPHWSPGRRFFNCAYLTVLKADTPAMLDGIDHEITGNIRGTYYENHAEGELGVTIPPYIVTYPIPVGERRFHDMTLSVPFTGVATRPSLASAVSRSGLVLRDEGVRFESDMVEAYFSKPMRQVELDSSKLALSGGSTLQKELRWTGERTAAIQVMNMTAIPHSLTAADLTDEAGNPVY